MVFVDSNIPMYLMGPDHVFKNRAFELIQKCTNKKSKLVSSTEVIQEILHRFTSLNKKNLIEPAFEAFYRIVEKVFEVTEQDVLKAKEIIFGYDGLQSRDAIHAAQMKRLGIEEIISFDKGFDRLPFIKRLF